MFSNYSKIKPFENLPLYGIIVAYGYRYNSNTRPWSYTLRESHYQVVQYVAMYDELASCQLHIVWQEA